MQRRLTIGAPDDAHEREADRVADQVMRMPEGRVLRGCADCEEGLQRQPAARGDAPPITGDLVARIRGLSSGGQSLPESERAFFEPRFGQDFSAVRVHTDRRSAALAHAVNARAFTVGRDVVFGAGEYAPGAAEGRRLLAHELTHVVQQRAGGMAVQRLVEVQPDAAAASDILSQFNFLCPGGNFTLNGQRIESACDSSSESCDCLCDVTTDSDRAYVIQVHNVTNTPQSVTLHDGTTETVPMPSEGPRTRLGTHPTIHMPSSTRSALAFGAFLPNGSPFVAENWRILGHELCGHGRLNQGYAGTGGDRPGHNATIDTENAIAAQHGEPARGKYKDTRQGESFHSLPASGAKLVFKLKDGWHHEHVP